MKPKRNQSANPTAADGSLRATKKPMGIRQLQKINTRNLIVATAEELFWEQGFDSTTIKQIAERANVSVGAIFLQAESKDDLLLLVMHNRLEKWIEEALKKKAKSTKIVDRLTSIYGHFLACYSADLELAKSFLRVQLFTPGRNKAPLLVLTQNFLLTICDILHQEQQLARLDSNVDALLLAQNTFSLYLTSLLGWLMMGTSLEEALESLRQSLEIQLKPYVL